MVPMRQLVRRALSATPDSFREALLRRTLAAAEEGAKFRAGQPTMWGSLQNLARIGFKPGGIIDVGANVGAWATTISSIFPNCPIHMVEAQPTLEPQLRATGFPYSITLLGPESRPSVPFFLSGTGSSVMEEVTTFDKEKVELPMQRLDDLQPVQSLPGPLLFKLDVQGFELEVLAGAGSTLDRTEVILSEVSLLPYNKGAPLMHEVIAYLAERDFLPYDICGGLRRSSDMALFQTDMIFVRRDSDLRARRKFWDHEPDR
jgi:FkbM family methyltransferase